MNLFSHDNIKAMCHRYKKYIPNPRTVIRIAPYAAILASAAFASQSHALSCTASADDWGSGYVVNVTVTNDSSSAISDWEVKLSHSSSPQVTGSWNANVTSSGSQVTATNVSWNGSLSAGQSTSFGYQGSHSGNFQVPSCVGSDGGNPATPTPTNNPTPTSGPTATPTSGPTATPQPTPTSGPGGNIVIQENEAGFCSVDGSIDNNNSGFTGGGFANTDNASGKGIVWSVSVANSGNYSLNWRFANGGGSNRPGSVIINGTDQATADFNGTGSWTSWTESSAVTVFLNSGNNTIRLEADTSGGLPNVDNISINGSGVNPGNCGGTTTPTATPGPTPTPTGTVSPTPTPPPTPTTIPGNCPDQLVGWATTNGGTTGGAGGTRQRVTSVSDLRSLAGSDSPRIIELSGTFNAGSSAIAIGSNTTIVGIGNNTTVFGGFTISNKSNIILKNLHIKSRNGPVDAIGVRGSTNLWFDHLAVSDGRDGILDLTRGTDLATVSWSKFFYEDTSAGHRLALLFGGGSTHGNTDTGKNNHTIHHNWFGQAVDQRMPRLLFGKGHIYNNYFNSPGNEYCVGSGSWASLLVENNYFKDVKDPHRFQDSNPSYITAVGNIYDNTSGKRDTGLGGSGSNPPGPFTNPPYAYSLDSAAGIPGLVQRCSGPQ